MIMFGQQQASQLTVMNDKYFQDLTKEYIYVYVD